MFDIRLWGLGLVALGLVFSPVASAYDITIDSVTEETALSFGPYDQFGSLSPDRLTAYTSSNFAGGHVRMYASKRATELSAWGAPVELTGIEINALDHYFGFLSPTLIDGDGTSFNELYFAAINPGQSYDVYRVIVDEKGVMGPPVNLVGINTPFKDDLTTMTADGLLAVYDRDLGPGAGENEMYFTTRTTVDDPWSFPVPINELNTMYNESRGQISPDGLEMMFSSDRPGSLGDRDIWYTARNSLADPFGAPIRLDDVSTPLFDSPDWWDPAGNLWLSRAQSPDIDVFVAELGVIPEPGTLLCLALGGLALLVRRR
jgi:hypothetical protein